MAPDFSEATTPMLLSKSNNDQASSGERSKTPQSQDTGATGSGTETSLEAQRRLRRERIEQRDVVIDVLKSRGNDEYKAGNWAAAADIYVQIVSHYGPNTNIFSNLSAALLKLKKNAEAEMAATDALRCDPLNQKARYRRGMARKAQGRITAAGYDLTMVMAMDKKNEEAFNECNALFFELEVLKVKFDVPETEKWRDPPNVDPIVRAHDEEWPHFDSGVEVDYDMVSDSEDSRHFASGVPCKDYNRDGCAKGKACKFAHCADVHSLRDGVGKNVCIMYLLSSCTVKNCKYAHDRTNLGSGWWTDGTMLEEIRQGVHEDRPKNLKSYIGKLLDPAEPEDIFKAFGPKKETPKRVEYLLIIYIHGTPDQHSKLLDTPVKKIKVESAFTASEALRHLSNPRFTCVIVADTAILEPRNASVAQKLVQFAKSGGTVVFGIDFGGHVVPKQMDKHFETTWNLPWRAGSYRENPSIANTTNRIFQPKMNLPSVYSVKALNLRNVDPVDVVYKPVDAPNAATPAPNEFAAAFTSYGEGSVGYVGDVDWEEDSFKIIYAMFDAPKRKGAPGLKGTPAQIKKAHETIASLPKVSYVDFFKERRQGFKLVGMDRSTLPIKKASRPIPVKPPPRPFILVISGGTLLSDIEEVQVLRNLDLQRNVDLLSSPDLKGVFVGSCDLLKNQFAYLIYRLAEYTRNGGTVILGGCFTHIETREAKPFYENWGLNWEMGIATSCEIEMNPDHPLLKQHPEISNSLPVKMKFDAQHTSGVAPEEVLYAADPLGEYGQGAVIHAKVGQGHFGYIGNTGFGMLSQFHTTLVLSMFGMPP